MVRKNPAVEPLLKELNQDETLLSVSCVLNKTGANLGLEDKVKLLEQTLDQAPAAIVITEPDGAICYVNQAFLDITKYSRDELMGKNPRILKLNTEAGIDYQKLWATLLSGKSWHGVFQNKKKNGEEYWERASIAPLYDDEGKLFKYIGIKQDITIVHADKVEMERLYLMDTLTNVYNRRSFFEQAEQAFARYQTDPEDSAVLMLDIDYFKHINDNHGHTKGDEALKKFGSVCSKTIRKDDLMGRIGGEEFAVYLMDTQMDEALGMAERLRTNVEKIVLNCETGKTISFTVSIGITKPLPSDESFEMVLKRADKAMYQAKRNGRNRVETLL